MVYNVYGPQQVDDAVRRYNSVANSAPTYRDSAATQNARLATDYFAKRYTDTVNKGYKSAYGDQISALADRYRISASTADEELLNEIARARGCLKNGGILDTERAAQLLIDDYRSGKLGRLSLERP